MTSIGYFPGCSLTGTSKEFDSSLRAVLQKLGVELVEIQDWNCCGATSAHVTNHVLATALPARNLHLAAQQGLQEVLAPCAACYNRLVSAQHEIDSSPEIRKEVETAIGEPISGRVEILNIVQLFDRIGHDRIAALLSTQIAGMKLACYYGCLLVRPANLTQFDDAERPTSMERLIEAAGGKTVDWNFKVECCGAAHSIAHTEVVVTLSERILADARLHGADAVVVACPMCHSNLDMRQKNMKKKIAEHVDMPVLFLTEVLGLALGLSPKALGLDLHFVDPNPVLTRAMAQEVTA